MNDKPCLLVEFDPLTWQIDAVYFKAETDEQAKKLAEILRQGEFCQMPEGAHYDA